MKNIHQTKPGQGKAWRLQELLNYRVWAQLSFVLGMLFLSQAAPTQAASDQWESTTPAGFTGTINAVASMDNYVYLGTNQGVYKSIDNGTSWTTTSPANINVTSIAIAWTYDWTNYVYVANATTPVYISTTNGIYKSELGSTTWAAVGTGFSEQNFNDLKIDQYKGFNTDPGVGPIGSGGDDPSGLYAAASSTGGVYRSDNAGGGWASTSAGLATTTTTTEKIKKLTTGFISGEIYALTTSNKLYASPLFSVDLATNESWSPVAVSSTILNNISTNNFDGNTIYLSTENGIFQSTKSAEGVITWIPINDGLTDLRINAVATDYTGNPIMYAASKQGAYLSIDSGAGWANANLGMGNVNVKDIVTNPTTSSSTYAITNNAVYRLQLNPGNLSLGQLASADTIAPAVIDDFSATNIASTSVNLNWTAPGDGGKSGTATAYEVRYSTSPINQANWAVAIPVTGEPVPLVAGAPQAMTVTGLQPDTVYYFAITTSDEVPNVSVVSPYTSAHTLVTDPDVTAPTIPTNLASAVISPTQINLSWTASTDAVGVAGYEIYRNGTSTLLATTSATTFNNTGLSASTAYTYTVRAYDVAGNKSNFATTTSATTQAAPTPPPVVSGGGGGGGGAPAVVDATAPARPQLISKLRKDGLIKLSWSNPTDTDFDSVSLIKTENQATSTNIQVVKLSGSILYTGATTTFSQTDLNPTKTAFYYLFAKDKTGNYSEGLLVMVGLITDPVSGTSVTTASASVSQPAGGVSYDQQVNKEAAPITGQQSAITLNTAEINQYQSVVKNQNLETTKKYAIAYFIKYGTPTTIKLGSGERAGVINSYQSAFNKLPSTTADWSDVIKLANGRWPTARSQQAEKNATELFKKIYQRTPNLKNANDNAAVTVIAYGLRPANRNTKSEQAAIKIYKGIFKKQPTVAIDWDMVRAIAYSGAKR